LEECVEAIKIHSRQYAKRQMTWFQNQMDVVWFTVDFAAFENTTNAVLDHLKSKK
jgi:tRNA dimethylallyltransferase